MSDPPDDDRPWGPDIDDELLEVDEAGAGAGLAKVVSLRDRLPIGTVGLAFKRGDHVELAHALVRELTHRGQTVFTEGSWWRYSEEKGVFRELSMEKLEVLVQQYAGCPVGKTYLKMRASDVSGVMRTAASQVHDKEFFVGAPKGITFQNGFVVVGKEKVFRFELKKENRARHCYPFGYKEDAEPKAFIDFLRSSFRDDDDADDKIELIRQFIGMTIIGEATRRQLALVLYGEGSNGKGVLFKLMAEMMPAGSVVSIAPQKMSQEYRAAMLAGKMLNLVSEMPEADIMDSEAFKAAIAGDQMEGRHITKSPFYFSPFAGHVFSANQFPATRDQSHGFWRRLVIVTFNRIFEGDADPYLYEKLRVELPLIVSWCINATPKVLSNESYTIPASAAAAKEKWQRAANHVIEYLEDRTVPAPPLENGTKASDLYRDYREWALAHGYKPLASNSFGERMRKRKLPPEKKRECNYYPVNLKHWQP